MDYGQPGGHVMSFLQQLAAQRKKFLEGLDANEGDINLDIFEDFYPDQAHFIFELLQNAEDAEATEAIFTLSQKECLFEHNGKKPFTEPNVRAITGIHNSTKIKSPDQIGKFGVGFKSVFVYTLTPIIRSRDFSFKITRLVLPEPVEDDATIGASTRFEFPFNNPKKTPPNAYTEVKAGLKELAETTLLFLSSLESIRWQISQEISGEVRRIQHPENHVEVMKRSGGKTTSSSHFLRFSDSVAGLERQRVSVAFALDRLPNVTVFDSQKALAKQFKIIPVTPGRVAVFFPAEKETSGLRFHLHVPFVPELSRASIKETPANDPLFKQLAELAAASLYRICELSLLDRDFLGVLPNQQDTLPPRYQTIRSVIVEEMNNKPLTPTHSKSHVPAKHLLQAKASLKDLLSEEDIELLFNFEDEPPKWAINAAPKNPNVDRFLDDLAITKWDLEQFVEFLEENATEAALQNPNDEFMAWLAKKPIEWHQQFYTLLFDHLMSAGWHKKQIIDKLKSLRIVRLFDGTYSVGSNSFFPNDGVEHDEVLPRVDVGVYTSGKNKIQQENARKFLVEVGVREVGEAELVEAILKKRYADEAENRDENTYRRDLKRFIALVENEPDKAKFFASSYIFKQKDGKWRQASGVFLDQPFLHTNLSAYYGAVDEDAKRTALDESYQDCGVAVENLVKFAEKVGVATKLKIQQSSCKENPDVGNLIHSAPGNWNYNGIDRDYTINGLADLFKEPNESLSHLVWGMASEQKNFNWITAGYRNNASHLERNAPSQLIALLRDSSWVPQTDGRFVRPAEASLDLLPEGFPFDSGWPWVKAIKFWEDVTHKFEELSHKQAVAKEWGFTDSESLERAKRFAKLPQEEQERFLADRERTATTELPEHESGNPELRAQRVGVQAAVAPERLTEDRTRSVPVGMDSVKGEAAQYLRQQYTNADDEMICQVCKASLPFKLDDGSYFFEMVQFVKHLKRWHAQNYLALCPNHSAMFQYANGSRDLMKEMFVEMEGQQLDVILAQADATIYFTKTHIADLRAVIEVDANGEPKGKA